MMRRALTTAVIRAPVLANTAARDFTTSSRPHCKARLNQLLEQVRSTESGVYKTVKEKTPDDKTVRRDQIIWLVKHSLGKKEGNVKPSPHDMPWSEGSAETEGRKDGDGVGVTVWPHLW